MDKSKRLLGMKAVTLKPKTIAENKLKAFNMGTMNIHKNLSKKELEEKRKKDDLVATAQVYQEFVESFEDGKQKPMSWVRGGTVQVKDEGRVVTESTGAVYTPKNRFTPQEERKDTPKDDTKDKNAKNFGKKKEEKKKSNLEIFKEELKLIQTERHERHRVKKMMRAAAGDAEVGGDDEMPEEVSPFMPVTKGSYVADPVDEATSTNIYVGNINPKMTEMQLCEVFGKYGPLASVKIMWPRSEEEKSRGRNCGFVAFMTRKDGERASEALKGTDVMGFEMKLGWGKPVPIPPHPVYIPPALAEMTLPPPPSGLPFNAQPMTDREFRKFMRVQPSHAPNKTLANAVVKVVVPTERNILALIHRMVEFVVREGPLFEAMIMNREMNNPMFRFLFENQIPAHTYYRWKIYSILQGDSTTTWRQEPFRMFKGGSIWRPPPMNPYSQGMPENLVGKEAEIQKEEDDLKKGDLTDTQRDRLEDMLRDLVPERLKVGDVMVWCLDHANAAEEVVQCITESLSIVETTLPKKIARIYLVSDILFNCGAKVPNASWFRKCVGNHGFMDSFQTTLEDICQQLRDTYTSIDGRLKAEQFKQRIMACFRAWEEWAVYPNDFLIRLQNIFLGLLPKVPEDLIEGDPGDMDGEVLEDDAPDIFSGDRTDDIDGKTLDESSEDIDGMAVTIEPDPAPALAATPAVDSTPVSKFTKSKWETVDQAQLESQAQAVSKWDLFESKVTEDVDGIPMDEEPMPTTPTRTGDPQVSESGSKGISEERRAKLRDIEVKVMKYQDEIESGKKSRKTDLSLSEQVEKYRQKLLHKEERKTEKEKIKEDRRRSGREKGRMTSSEESDVEVQVSHNLARLRAQYADSPRGRSRSRSPRNSPYTARATSPRRSAKRSGRRSRSRSRSPLVSYGSRSPKSPLRHKHKHKKRH